MADEHQETRKHDVEWRILPPGAPPTILYIKGFLAGMQYCASKLWRGKSILGIPIVQPEMDRDIVLLNQYLIDRQRALRGAMGKSYPQEGSTDVSA